KTGFLNQFRASVAAVDLTSPPEVDELVAAANFVQVLWQERAKDRNAIANSIFKIIPPPTRWPLDHRRLTGARLLVALGQSNEMPEQAVNNLFDACAHIPEEFDITTCDARGLFLYLFNIWAVQVARGPHGLKNLIESQHRIFWTGLLS